MRLRHPVWRFPLKMHPQKILQIAKLRCRGILEQFFERFQKIVKFEFVPCVYVSSKSQHLSNRKTEILWHLALQNCIGKFGSIWICTMYISSNSQNPPIRKSVILLYLRQKLLGGVILTPLMTFRLICTTDSELTVILDTYHNEWAGVDIHWF